MNHSNKFEKIVDYLRQCNDDKVFIKRLYFEFFIQDSEEFSDAYKEGWCHRFRDIRLPHEKFKNQVNMDEYNKGWNDADCE